MDGILNQVTEFDYELIIYDDYSLDKSRDVIQSIVSAYKGKCEIKLVFPSENQYSKGFTVIPFMLPYVEGEYIAICEGDDYWIDNNKLQKQYESLKHDHSVDICFHPSFTLLDGNIQDKGYGYLEEEGKKIDYSQVVMKGGSMMPMASIFSELSRYLILFRKMKSFLREIFTIQYYRL